ncbi:MAG TPA: hypothetical protein VG518_05775 [Solirubrobacterales bacterium]|nr:hypothetical protein [Solirubrobacterales bacterium]
MLDLGRYLLGVAEVIWLAGFAGLAGLALRRRLAPELTGAPAHLAGVVLALALLLLTAELLGSFALFEPFPYLLSVAAVAIGAWALLRPAAEDKEGRGGSRPQHPPHPQTGADGQGIRLATLIALAIAALALLHFGAGARARLGTGMTGFDSTWYHGPFAAGFFQSGDTWHLHFIAPQFLAWFYPANSELFHALGMLAFGRDVLSPLLNLGWFVGCLLACWCIGRPYRVAPWSLALGALALSLPVLSDQAGEARNDLVGTFFLLSAVAIALNAGGRGSAPERGPGTGALAIVGLAVGLAAGTKLNFLLPGAVLVLGLAALAPAGSRLRALSSLGLGALAGGGYWYLRNLAHSGNPLPWFDGLGPLSLPSPAQALGGREAHAVLDYLGDGGVWSGWFLPGLHAGLSALWPLVLCAALAGALLSLRGLPRGADRVLGLAGLLVLAVGLAWLVAPTSASGPEGLPRGFESGLRYLAPALVLGLTLLPTAPRLRPRCQGIASRSVGAGFGPRGAGLGPARFGRHWWRWGLAALAVLAVGFGFPVQRHYLKARYADPSFAAPGLNKAFAWARGVSGARIATTSTRQYPLFGTDLSNRVQYVGRQTPHGGFVAPRTCRAWRRLLNEGGYDYVVASRDRLEPGKPPYPDAARWTAGPQAAVVLRKPPTVVFRLSGRLDPSACPS